MHMQLTAEKRTAFGRSVKKLRNDGFIPAELYGRGVKNEHLAVSAKEFGNVFRAAGESAMITILVGKEKHSALIHDVQFDAVSDEPLAIDFYQVRLDEKIRVKVSLVFSGVAPAVKDAGGVLVKALQEIEIEALPADIPRDLSVPLESLRAIGESIYVRDLTAPERVRLLLEPMTVVASAIAKVSEAEEAAMAATVDVGAIKAEAEDKKAERAAAAPDAKTESSEAPKKEGAEEKKP